MQLRNLKIKVPITYKRIFTVRKFPKDLQDEITKYPEVIAEDSSYESDDTVEQKYRENPLTYIINDDERKRETVE